jgi:hypothetical protein
MAGQDAYSALGYWSVAVYPRTKVREPYPSRRRRALVVPAVVQGVRFARGMADVLASGPRPK